MKRGGPLTPNECAVMEARAKGEPIKSIAVRMSITQGAVGNMQTRAVAKLGARNVHDAVRRWLRLRVSTTSTA